MTSANLEPKDAVNHDQVKALVSISESSEQGPAAHEVLARCLFAKDRPPVRRKIGHPWPACG